MGMGANGGVRLLLHVERFDFPPGGITEDPCGLLDPLTSLGDFVVDAEASADTVMVWAYFYHPRSMAVQGVGFGIEYEGVGFVCSGTCAKVVGQHPEIMGEWPVSGSEIAFAWLPDDFPVGRLAPVAWFVLAGEERDGYFRVTPGQSSMTGSVGDAGMPPRENRIWDYGQIGFGETAGELPVPVPEEIPGAWGALKVVVR
jgi:hypothetical protein